MERKTVIKLSGSMAQRFGRIHRRALTSASEVFRALSNTIDGFDAYLRETRAKGLDFVIFRNQINIGKEEFELLGLVMSSVLSLSYAVVKGRGSFKLLLPPQLRPLQWNPIGWAASTQMALYAAAGSMAVGGVVQMLSPQVSGLRMRQEPDNKPSYAFGGPVNTTASGNPVPLLYGQREIGGAIISAGVYAEDQQ